MMGAASEHAERVDTHIDAVCRVTVARLCSARPCWRWTVVDTAAASFATFFSFILLTLRSGEDDQEHRQSRRHQGHVARYTRRRRRRHPPPSTTCEPVENAVPLNHRSEEKRADPCVIIIPCSRINGLHTQYSTVHQEAG